MPYIANIYRVFIASPGDVTQERDAIRSVVWEWNTSHAASRGVFLEPVGWETHSAPELGDRPQALINKQILNDADLLIGVFWTRLGTATGSHLSGTVEEIEEHLAANKPAMIYFSDSPVKPNSVDEKQLSSLREFRLKLQMRGLIESYSSLSEFIQKFTRQLQRTINDTNRFESASVVSPVYEDASLLPSVGVSMDAMELLAETVKQGGQIFAVRHSGGYHIQIGSEVEIDTSTPRLSAKWRSAIEELNSVGYIRDEGYKGEAFEVTEKGYQVCEALKL